MWKRFDTQSKRNNTMKSDQISPPKKQNLRDSKSIVFIVVWASVATILLIIKTFSQSQVIGRDSTPLQYEAKKNWHGGSPTDLYKGINLDITETISWMKPLRMLSIGEIYCKSMCRVPKVIYRSSRFLLLWRR